MDEMADGVGIPVESMNFNESIKHVFTPIHTIPSFNGSYSVLELLNVSRKGDHVGVCIHVLILVCVAHKGYFKVNTHSMHGLRVANNVRNLVLDGFNPLRHGLRAVDNERKLDLHSVYLFNQGGIEIHFESLQVPRLKSHEFVQCLFGGLKVAE